MRLRTTATLAAAALGLAIPASGLAEVSTTIGTGKKTCVLKPGADCRGVVHRWTVEHHGNLRKAKFTKADLRGADFRGADLRGADFRGAKMRHAEFRGANLRGARFDAPPKAGKHESGNSGGVQVGDPDRCWPQCPGADLSHAQFVETQLFDGNFAGANLSFANLTIARLNSANLIGANLTGANLTGAWLIRADLSGGNLRSAFINKANLTSANLTSANLTNANFTSATLTGANFTSANRTGATFTNAIGTAQFKTVGGGFVAIASLIGSNVANWSFSASWQTPITGVSFGGYGTTNCPGSYEVPSAAPGYICLYPNAVDLYYAVSAQTLETYRECTVTTFGFACIENWYGSGAPSLSIANPNCQNYCHHAFPNFRGSWAVTPLTS